MLQVIRTQLPGFSPGVHHLPKLSSHGGYQRGGWMSGIRSGKIHSHVYSHALNSKSDGQVKSEDGGEEECPHMRKSFYIHNSMCYSLLYHPELRWAPNLKVIDLSQSYEERSLQSRHNTQCHQVCPEIFPVLAWGTVMCTPKFPQHCVKYIRCGVILFSPV
jgi:hypothetical protein